MALDLKDYNKTLWAPTMPITEDRMNKLEEGVYVNREALQSLDNTVTTQGNAITTLNTNVDTKLNQEQVDNRIILQLSGISQDSEMGRNAWTAIANATTSANPTPYGSLTERFTANETLIANLRAALGQIKNTDTNKIEDIYTSNNTVANALINLNSTVGAINEEIGASLGRHPDTGVPNTQFRQHMNQIDEAINTLKNSMNTIFDSTGVDDNNQRIALSVRMAQLIALDAEVQAAHREIAENAEPDTLAKRFHDIEVDIGRLQDSKVNIGDIVDELNRTDTKRPLSANMGKMLKDTIGGTYSPTNTVASAIAKAQSTAEEYADNNKIDKTKIYNGLDYETTEQNVTKHSVLDAAQGKALKDLLDNIDSAYKVADTALDERLTAAEGALDTLNSGAETEGSVLNTVNTRIADVVAEAPEAFDTLKEIADWIGTHNTSALEMQQDIADNATAIAALEDTITDENTGLAATKAIADAAAVKTEVDSTLNGLNTRLNAIDGGEALTSAKTLATRVSEAESAIDTLQNEPKSATEVISVEDFEALTANEANSHKDYLVGPDENNLYKYYHIIETSDNVYEKVLISGGTTGGTSSAQFAATTEEITNPNINTDYYVGNNTDGYLHYRYIEQDNILKRVLIGNNNYYQIDSHEEQDSNGETSTYLDLYKFDSARTQASITDADNVNIIGTVKLPKGGSASSAERIYVKIPAGQSQYISYKDLENDGLSLGFSYTCYSLIGGDYEYTDAVYEFALEDGRIIKTSNGVIPALSREAYNNNTINISFNKTDNLAQYCKKNQGTKFILTLSVPGSKDIIPRSLTVTITALELTLSSNFSDQQTYYNTDNLIIPYQFTGITGEDISFEVLFGNNESEENITDSCAINLISSRITIPKTILANKTGVYNLRIRAGQLVSGSMLYSNALTYQLGLIDNNSSEVLLFSGESLEEQNINQYETIRLPYYLYLPSNITNATVNYDVKQVIYNNQQEVVREDSISSLVRPADTLSTGSHTYLLRISTMLAEVEYYKVIITCMNKSLTFNIKANIAKEQINIETSGLVFNFNPELFSNNAPTLEEKLWHYENNGIKYAMRIPEGAHFDWRTGGWIEDENHIPCFCVKAGSKVEFTQQTIGQEDITPLTLFWNNMETNGSNFKCVFKIDNVKTPDAPFLTSLDTVNNTVINYGKLILSEKQDIEDEDTLLHSYLNTKYLYTKTLNSSNKVVKESVGTTVLNDGNNGRFSSQLTEAKRSAAETKAAKKNTDKIKGYINNIYTIANYARTLEHKEALLNILSGNPIGTVIDYTTIKDTILEYLQNVENATNVYNTLISLENDTSSIIFAYRQEEAENLDAILNGFVVEGKEGKDGIIAMLEFTFATTIENGGTFTSQVISDDPISTNSFTSTATFLVTVEDKKYEVTLKNDNGTYTEIVSIQDASSETQTAYGLELNALGSNIYLPSGRVNYAHSEGDTIEFEYNINAPLERKINSSIIIYEDGVPSAAKLYTTGNSILEQTAPGSLTIGSDDCDVYIYKMRLYNRALTDKQILSNFYADGLTVDDMMARYNRNKNLITNNIDELTPQLVAQECPDLRVIMIEAPNLTGGKTSFIKNTKIRCIYKNGRPEDNWVALNAYHAGQGTSSDNYGASARNLDIIFGFDGKDTVIVPKPQKNNYQFDPNYKSILIKGLDNDTSNDIKTAEEYENAGYNVYYNDTDKEPGTVSLTEKSVPNNWFNIKVNVASSENTNNAFLQKRFDRYLQQHVYKTPAQKRDSKIKNDMEFFNCVIFIKETDTPKEFVNDNGAERHWHFYGIGNIGDSKKTDKTRVNVPNDPYEFAVEITDNGLLLSGFSSGVFYISEASKIRSQTDRSQINGNADIPEALTMTQSHVCTSSEYTFSNGNYSFSISSPDNKTMYFVPENSAEYYRRFIYLNNNWTEVGEPISFKRTSYGIKYPISKAEWECSLNEYHKKLYDFGGKGWDKSFEFRYDITTKDGETVARNDLEEALNKLHQSTNKKAFADMYSYIVTVPNANFVSQLNNWFIENSLPYWYLFTERYTMIDSRAKNTFYHYGKVYISDDEYNGVIKDQLNAMTSSQFLSAYNQEHPDKPIVKIDDNVTADKIAEAELAFRQAIANFIFKNRDTFTLDNTQAAINNGYRFELWGYDMDTALGINNNGQMVFNAGIEDIDKDASGWIYNEAESVIWRRVRENMYNQLAALYVNLKGDCFNAENLIQEFDRLQAQFPEELWRADFERKYYRPFRDLNETTYLNDMANGRKKYQRRQFERNMAIYINSKYQRNGSYIENDLISFRPQFTWTEGRDTKITIKPYSTMYINFALGNYDNTDDTTLSNTQSIFKRVERGDEFVINTADYIHDYNNIQCILYNASRIMYLDGLGNFECKQFILGAASKLSVLKLGSSTYVNHSMTDITNLGLSTGLPLLEELDLSNIEFGTNTNGTWTSNPPQTFALENFPLLKKLNATGSNIRSFTFKDGGMLEHIVFPSILTKIEFKNLYNLIDTYDDNNELIPAVELTGTANLISYNSTQSYSNSWQIVQNMIDNNKNRITELKLDDINWTINNMSELEPLVELQERLGNNMYLKGIIHVTGKWSKIERDKYLAIWSVIFDTSAGTEEYKYEVVYMDSSHIENGALVAPKKISSMIVSSADDTVIPDIYYGKELPTRLPTKEKQYSFGRSSTSGYIKYSGWSTTDKGATPLSDAGYNINNEYTVGRAIINKDGKIILYTWYKEEDHQYQIEWYLKRAKTSSETEELVYTQYVNNASDTGYGGGYTLNAPTVQYLHGQGYQTSMVNWEDDDNVSYAIFKGWEKLPANINPTTADEINTSVYKIYGQWDEADNVPVSEIFSDINNTNTLNTVQLLILANMTPDRLSHFGLSGKDLFKYRKYKYSAGYKGILEGTKLLSTPAVFSGDTNQPISNLLSNEIMPFANNNGFTLVLDYQFAEETRSLSKNSILAACYAKVSGTGTSGYSYTGFSLCHRYETNDIVIKYGNINNFTDTNLYKIIGNTSDRNIIVIRHPKDSTELIIYSAKTNSGTTLDTTVYVDTIDFSTFVANSDAKLCIGALRNDVNWVGTSNTNSLYTAERNSVTYGQGIINEAIYWDTDLGNGECAQLAMWPHEDVTMIVADVNTEHKSNNLPVIYLTALTSSAHGYFMPTQYGSIGTTGNIGDSLVRSWEDMGGGTTLRDICDKKMFNGLPIELQSILYPTSLGYCAYTSTIARDSVTLDKIAVTGLEQRISYNNYVYLSSVSSYATSISEFNNTNYNYESKYENTGVNDDKITSNITPYTWMGDSECLQVYNNFNPNSTTETTWTLADDNYDYYNLRFDYPINWSTSTPLRIYEISFQTLTERPYYNIIPNIKTGDIIVNTEDKIAYMYVDNNTITNYGLKTEYASSTSNRYYTDYGGWIKSRPYATRSAYRSGNTGTSNKDSIVYINAVGKPIGLTTGQQVPGNGVGFSHSFAI